MVTQSDNVTFDFNRFHTIRMRSLGRISWRLKRFIDGFLEPRIQARGFADFKLSYLGVLANIEEAGTTNNELAKRACVTKQMMSKTVSLLEKEGYIYLEKNASDSRSNVIYLNKRGKELFLNLHECVTEMNEHFRQILGTDRLEELIDTMKFLVDELDKLPTAFPGCPGTEGS
ncbi:MarR family transcriptional regulator [Rudanella paleaurantiibacter]|uniref:MarR family transcriptional regulator n=1 Tax=Rudanella paleaurantiibacter TaxID=2614655 RepID=A0A7J5U6T6_9BACT|nr:MULTISPECIES: MarR family winged helix-turn-helix transcriptional regulator [Rudanella]KAB7732870.1 MarR family transcriptional regulator [Rudanella paleaurantiibacter]